jgi:hypothetical protein
MRRIPKLLFALVALASASCTPDPKLALRSANDPQLPPGQPGIRLTVGSSSSEAASPAAASKDASAIATKGGDVPTSVLVINADAKDVAAVEKALKPEQKFATDLTALKRVLVFTISKGAYRPADRIVRLRIRVSPTNFAFSDYAASATSYSSVTIDKLDLTQDNSISGTINPTFATGLTGIAQLTASADRKLDETSEIALHPLDLNVNLDGPELVIDREAERGQELAGNILVKITVRPIPRIADQSDEQEILYDLVATDMKLLDEKTGVDLAPEKASISTALLRHFAPSDLKAHVMLEYVERHVLAGQNTYAEYNQTVSFDSPSDPDACSWSDVTVVSATDLYVPLWGIDAVGNGVIEIQDAAGYRPLAFEDPVDATDVLKWMSRRSARVIGERRLNIDASVGYPKLRLQPLTALDKPLRASGGLQCPPPKK